MPMDSVHASSILGNLSAPQAPFVNGVQTSSVAQRRSIDATVPVHDTSHGFQSSGKIVGISNGTLPLESPEIYDSLVTVKGGLHSCRLCTFTSRIRRVMRVHLRKHTGEQPPTYPCHLCPAVFNHDCDLKRHLRSHIGERPYSCTHCTSSFTQRCHLKVHLRTHTGERPYSCVYCPASFTSKYTLTTHLRGHTGERPFSCVHCGSTFMKKYNLKIHISRCPALKES